MLIHAGEEKNVGLQAALMPGEEIGQYLLIGVPEMGRTIDVINRGSEKIRTGHAATLLGEISMASAYSIELVPIALRAGLDL